MNNELLKLMELRIDQLEDRVLKLLKERSFIPRSMEAANAEKWLLDNYDTKSYSGYSDDELIKRYTEFLIEKKRYEEYWNNQERRSVRGN